MMLPLTSLKDYLQQFVGTWYEALENPAETQEQVLLDLTKHYEKTEYGQRHFISNSSDIESFQSSFPELNYERLTPFLKLVKQGNYHALLSEPPTCWVMTRGSTGASKVLPVTKTHLEQIFSCGARALVNHVLKKNDLAMLTGKILNLNFPSVVRRSDEIGVFGYSSGTYARLNPMFSRLTLLPKQEEIDNLGPGILRSDWEKRFEYVYQKALNENVTAAMGVTPVILSFAKYVAKVHRKRPKEIWQLKALFCTSVRKIHFKYGPKLRQYFGEAPIVEMYTATEGVFGQQLDDLPYVSPNYDKYLFEVKTGKGTKLLHALKKEEWGTLIVSSCMFPRYSIGDLIQAKGKGYFRVIGRATALTKLEHRAHRLLYGWLL